MMPRLAFGWPWRQTEDLLGLIPLGLDLTAPEPVRASAATPLPILLPQRRLGVATALKKASDPLHVVIDSPLASGFAGGAYDRKPVYRSVAGHTLDAAVIIPPCSTGVPSDTANTDPAQRNQHLQMIKERDRLGWQCAVGYGRRSLGAVAMPRYKFTGLF
jgi:hypothetical protein